MAGKLFIGTRYGNSQIIQENGGELLFVTPRKPLTNKAFFDNIVHTVKASDRIDSISSFYYGVPGYGWVIADFNNFLFPDEDLHNFKTILLPSASRLFDEILPRA